MGLALRCGSGHTTSHSGGRELVVIVHTATCEKGKYTIYKLHCWFVHAHNPAYIIRTASMQMVEQNCFVPDKDVRGQNILQLQSVLREMLNITTITIT